MVAMSAQGYPDVPPTEAEDAAAVAAYIVENAGALAAYTAEDAAGVAAYAVANAATYAADVALNAAVITTGFTNLVYYSDPSVDPLGDEAPPRALTIEQLQAAIDHCANFQSGACTVLDGHVTEAWVIVRAAHLGLSPVTDADGEPLSREAVIALAGTGQDAVIVAAADWLVETAWNEDKRLDNAHSSASEVTREMIYAAFAARDLERVAELSIHQWILLVSNGVLPLPDAVTPAAWENFDEVALEGALR